MSRWLVIAIGAVAAERAGAQSQPPLQWPEPPTFSSVPPEDWQRNQPPPHRPAEGDWHRPARKVEPMPVNPAVTVEPQGNPWLLRPKPPLVMIPAWPDAQRVTRLEEPPMPRQGPGRLSLR